MIKKCILPDCSKNIPESRLKQKRIIVTCSKKCSNLWLHLSTSLRRRLRKESLIFEQQLNADKEQKAN